MNNLKKTLITGAMAIGGAVSASASDLSPVNWPAEIRETAEKAVSVGMTPQESRVYAGKNGAISRTTSAISAAAGLVTLQTGGTAPDARTPVAITGMSSDEPTSGLQSLTPHSFSILCLHKKHTT